MDNNNINDDDDDDNNNNNNTAVDEPEKDVLVCCSCDSLIVPGYFDRHSKICFSLRYWGETDFRITESLQLQLVLLEVVKLNLMLVKDQNIKTIITEFVDELSRLCTYSADIESDQTDQELTGKIVAAKKKVEILLATTAAEKPLAKLKLTRDGLREKLDKVYHIFKLKLGACKNIRSTQQSLLALAEEMKAVTANSNSNSNSNSNTSNESQSEAPPDEKDLPPSFRDFQYMQMICKGAYGQVFLARHKVFSHHPIPALHC